MSRMKLETLRVWLEEIMRIGFIRLGCFPVSSPVPFVAKPEGDPRASTNCWGLIAASEKDQYSLLLKRETSGFSKRMSDLRILCKDDRFFKDWFRSSVQRGADKKSQWYLTVSVSSLGYLSSYLYASGWVECLLPDKILDDFFVSVYRFTLPSLPWRYPDVYLDKRGARDTVLDLLRKQKP